MAMAGNHSANELSGNINVTPMIDILLVLLIIFMVIVPAAPNGLKAQLPQRSPNSTQSSEAAIVVQVLASRDGVLNYKIDRNDVARNELGNRLAAILATRADKALFIKGDSNLDFSAIAQVVDIGRGAGASHIGLLTPKGSL